MAPAVAVVAVWAVPLIPTSQATADPSGPPDFTVVNLNLQYGRADARELAAQVDPDTDVVVLQEYTPSYTAELEAVGLLDDFPYREGTERTDAGGTLVLSRTPLEIVDRTDTAFDNLMVRLELAGVTWQVAAIHSTPPHFGAEAWTEDAFKVNAMIMEHQEENLVIVGDFNAIVEHHPMRVLLKNPNIVDPMTGRTGPDRFQPTWPVGKVAPRFARIDHFFTSAQVLPQVPHHFAVAGTDHLGIAASVCLTAHAPIASCIAGDVRSDRVVSCAGRPNTSPTEWRHHHLLCLNCQQSSTGVARTQRSASDHAGTGHPVMQGTLVWIGQRQDDVDDPDRPQTGRLSGEHPDHRATQ